MSNIRSKCKSHHYLQAGFPEKPGLPITGVLLQVGLDVEAIDCISLVSFGSGRKELFWTSE